MCGKIKPSVSVYNRFGINEIPGIITPGERIYAFKDKVVPMTFGLNEGKLYNIRNETASEKFSSIADNVVGIVTDRYVEKGNLIKLSTGYIPVGLFNDKEEVAILTEHDPTYGRKPVSLPWEFIRNWYEAA